MKNEITVTGIPPIDIDPPEGSKWGGPKWGKVKTGDLFLTQSSEWVIATGSPIMEYVYCEQIFTHREDGTPLEIDPLPDPSAYGDNVERLEYRRVSDLVGLNKVKPDSDFWAYFAHGEWCKNIQTHTPSKALEHCLLGYYKKEQTAQEVLKAQGFTVGDRVTLARKVDWEGWLHDFDGHVGKTFTIIDTSRDDGVKGAGEILKFSGMDYWYPASACDVVEPAKPKPTTLEDLVGEDGQKNAYIHWEGGSVVTYRVCKEDHETPFRELIEGTFDKLSNEHIRWSHSPFTAYEDAKPFIVEGGDA